MYTDFLEGREKVAFASGNQSDEEIFFSLNNWVKISVACRDFLLQLQTTCGLLCMGG